MTDEGGVDLTPIYRANAKVWMVSGAIAMACGAILCLFVGVVGLALVALGLLKTLWGAISWLRYNNWKLS